MREVAKAESKLRLAELIAARSLATDLGMGQPMEKAMRSCLIALGLGRCLDSDAATLSDIYYLALLEHIGCTSHASEWASYVGGDEIAMRTHAVTFSNSPMGEVMAAFIRHVGEGLPLRQRAALVAAMMRDGNSRFKHIAATDCEAAVCLAQRMHLSPGVLTSLGQTLETWNGKGGPARLKGDQISLPMRVVAVAHDAEVVTLRRHQLAEQLCQLVLRKLVQDIDSGLRHSGTKAGELLLVARPGVVN